MKNGIFTSTLYYIKSSRWNLQNNNFQFIGHQPMRSINFWEMENKWDVPYNCLNSSPRETVQDAEQRGNWQYPWIENMEMGDREANVGRIFRTVHIPGENCTDWKLWSSHKTENKSSPYRLEEIRTIHWALGGVLWRILP